VANQIDPPLQFRILFSFLHFQIGNGHKKWPIKKFYVNFYQESRTKQFHMDEKHKKICFQ